jgi:hypothetical protein
MEAIFRMVAIVTMSFHTNSRMNTAQSAGRWPVKWVGCSMRKSIGFFVRGAIQKAPNTLLPALRLNSLE